MSPPRKLGPVPTSQITVNGLRSPLLQAGPADAREAVVFVHGNPGSSRDWGDLVARVGDHGRAVALDMPGFGQADKSADFDATVGGYASHLDAALRELGIDRVHLVLHDFGGPFGLAWAIGHPDAFASATLINTGILIGYRWHRMAGLWRTPVLGELVQAATTRGAFRRAIGHAEPRGLPREFLDRMYDDYDRATRRTVLRLYRSSPVDDGAMDQVVPAFAALDRPALVVWGRHDPYVPVEQAELQRRSFPSAEVVVLDDSGHWPMVDDPEATAAAVLPFLAAQLGRPRPT